MLLQLMQFGLLFLLNFYFYLCSLLGPPAYKQLKQAIIDGNEDKAIAIYTSREGGRSPMTDIHPSKPFPSKKQLSEETPLHLAAKFSLIKLFEMFLEYGGNPGIGNARNENCIHSVCLLSSYPAKRAELVELIIEWRGVRSDNTIEKVMLDHVDVDGNTAMHLAAYNGLLQCIECLIEAGATLSVQNSEGATCCEIADKGGNPGVGTMLELAWVYKPIDQSIIASDNYHKFSNDLQTARIILDCRSLTLDGLSKFIEHAITFISESLGEKRSRAEVLLSHFSWDASKLKKEYLSNSDRVLTSARLHAKPELDKPEESDVQKTGQINVGISIDDVFLDNCYKPNTPYVVYKDGKRYTYAIKYFNGRTGVFPIDFDPTKSQVSDYSDTSHITPKKTDPCPICTEIMHESCNVQHFVSGNLVEPKHRELKCLSGHKYCFSCWSDHLQAQVMRENGVGCLPCPGYNCGEILDLEWAPVMLKSPDLVNRLLAQRQRQVIDSTNLKWCPVANCGLLVHITSTARPGETTVSSPQSVVCANGHGFCLSCSREAHSPCSCADLIIWQEEVREETKNTDLKSPDNIANVLVSTPSSKKCASCSTMVNKEDGCNHMM